MERRSTTPPIPSSISMTTHIKLRPFDPDNSVKSLSAWCEYVSSLKTEFLWSDVMTIVMAGSALKGRAYDWFLNWDDSGKTWAELSADLLKVFTGNANFGGRYKSAVSYTSNSATHYSQYCRGKRRRLENLLPLTEAKLVLIAIEDIAEPEVRQLLSTRDINTFDDLHERIMRYEELKTRTPKHVIDVEPRDSKRVKNENTTDNRRCYDCGKVGHVKAACRQLLAADKQGLSNNKKLIPTCTFCLKKGHAVSDCWARQRSKF